MTLTTEKLVSFWREQVGLDMRPPATPDQIAQFESANEVVLPVDLRDYLQQVDGFSQENGYQDENGYNFWPLNKISKLSTIDSGKFHAVGFDDFYVFADYLDFCWAYAIRLQYDTLQRNIAIVGTADGMPQLIANSFDEFLHLYLVGDAQIQPS